MADQDQDPENEINTPPLQTDDFDGGVATLVAEDDQDTDSSETNLNEEPVDFDNVVNIFQKNFDEIATPPETKLFRENASEIAPALTPDDDAYNPYNHDPSDHGYDINTQAGQDEIQHAVHSGSGTGMFNVSGAYRKFIETLEEEEEKRDGSTTRRYLALDSIAETAARNIQILEQQIAETEAEILALQEELSETFEELGYDITSEDLATEEGRQRAAALLRADREATEADLAAAEKELKEIDQEIKALTESTDRLKADQESLTQMIRDGVGKLSLRDASNILSPDGMRCTIPGLDDNTIDVSATADAIGAKIEQMNARVEELSPQVDAALAEIQALRDRLSKIEGAEDRLEALNEREAEYLELQRNLEIEQRRMELAKSPEYQELLASGAHPEVLATFMEERMGEDVYGGMMWENKEERDAVIDYRTEVWNLEQKEKRQDEIAAEREALTAQSAELGTEYTAVQAEQERLLAEQNDIASRQSEITESIESIDAQEQELLERAETIQDIADTNTQVAGIIAGLVEDGTSRSDYINQMTGGGFVAFHYNNAVSALNPFADGKYDKVESHVNIDGKVVVQAEDGTFHLLEGRNGDMTAVTDPAIIADIRSQMWVEGLPLGNETNYAGNILDSLIGGRSVKLAEFEVSDAGAQLQAEIQSYEDQLAALDEQRAAFDEQREALAQEAQLNEEQLAELDALAENMSTQLDELNAQMALLGAQNLALLAEEGKVQEAITELKGNLASATQNIASFFGIDLSKGTCSIAGHDQQPEVFGGNGILQAIKNFAFDKVPLIERNVVTSAASDMHCSADSPTTTEAFASASANTGATPTDNTPAASPPTPGFGIDGNAA